MNYPVDNVEGRSMENTIVLSNNTVVNLDTSMSERIEQIASAAYESIAHLDRYEKECERLYLKIAHMNSTAIDNFATQGVYLAEIHAIVTPLYHGIPLKDVDGDYVIDESEETIDASLEEAFRSCEDMVAEIAALQ